MAGLAAGLLLASPQPASAANLVTNPGFESDGTDGMPSCWEKSGWGDNDFTFATVADSHSGSKAMKVTLTRRVDGDRKALITESATCAPVVAAGKQYDLGLWYKSTTPDTAITLGTTPRRAGSTGPTSRRWTWRRAGTQAGALCTPAVPAGTDRITWGVSVHTGSATTDDYTMEQVSDPIPPATCTATTDECAGGRWTCCPRRTRCAPCTPSSEQRQGAADRRVRQQRGELRRRHLHLRGLRPGEGHVQGDPHGRRTCSARVTSSSPTGGCW